LSRLHLLAERIGIALQTNTKPRITPADPSWWSQPASDKILDGLKALGEGYGTGNVVSDDGLRLPILGLLGRAVTAIVSGGRGAIDVSKQVFSEKPNFEPGKSDLKESGKILSQTFCDAGSKH